MAEPAETTPTTTPARTRSGIGPKGIVALVIAVLALIIVFQNTASRDVHFLFWKASMPVWVWLGAMLLAGYIIGSIFPLFRRRGRTKK
ncbi:MAG TPA: LapA family protein [Marmoricola sp.]